jgi:hypothetical protein
MARATQAAGSIRELARRVGKSHVAVRKWLADPRFPFARSGPWDAKTVAAIDQWAGRTLSPDPAAGETAAAGDGEIAVSSSSAKAKLALTVEKVKAARQKREIEAKLFHRIDDCRNRRIRQLSVLSRELQEMPESAPFDLPVKDWFRSRVREILDRFGADYTADPR